MHARRCHADNLVRSSGRAEPPRVLLRSKVTRPFAKASAAPCASAHPPNGQRTGPRSVMRGGRASGWPPPQLHASMSTTYLIVQCNLTRRFRLRHTLAPQGTQSAGLEVSDVACGFDSSLLLSAVSVPACAPHACVAHEQGALWRPPIGSTSAPATQVQLEGSHRCIHSASRCLAHVPAYR